MSRRREIPQRIPPADPVYNSALVSLFINHMMWEGKKSVASRIFYDAMKLVEQRGDEEPLKLFKRAVEACKPVVEVKSRRVGGANYQVPIEVPQKRRNALAIRWLISYARSRGEKGMAERLSAEILEAAAGRGSTLKKKEDVHRMAEANKAFAHYRW